MSTVYNRILQVFKDVFVNVYFPRIGFLDVLEIAIIVLLIYYVAKAFKNTRTWILVKGAGVIGILYIVAYLLSFNVITKIFESILLIIVASIVIIFSPEIKRFLESIGTKQVKKTFISFFKQQTDKTKVSNKTIDELVSACEQMSKEKTGALIVYENEIPLNEYVDTGIKMNAEVSRQLLLNVFENNTPLHDGAVIVSNDKILAATCYLPLSEDKKISKRHGTRHRAAVGISEATDALTIIVSEETGKISITKSGKLRTVTANELRFELENFQHETTTKEKPKPIERFKKNTALKIVSLLAGIIGWLVIINVSNPEIAITVDSVPITIINEQVITDVNKTYTIESERYVDVVVSGHRSEVERITKDDILVVADLSKLSEINTVRLSATSKNPDVELEIRNEIMKVDIERCITSMFDITINKTGTENPSFYVDKITPPSDKLQISGPESKINQIDKVIFTVDVTDCDKDFDVTCKPVLLDKRGNTLSNDAFEFEQTEVNLSVHTLPTKKVPLIINPICSNYIKQYINTFSALPTEVMIAAEQRMLDNTNILELNIPIELSYEDLIKETHTLKIDISQYVSDGFYVPDAYKEVDVIIGFAGEIKKEISFSLQDIDIRNLDEEKYAITIQQNEFRISVFGSKESVMNTNIGTLNPYIDLTNISEGNNTVYIEFASSGNLMVTSCKINIVATRIVEETEPPTQPDETTPPTEPTIAE